MKQIEVKGDYVCERVPLVPMIEEREAKEMELTSTCFPSGDQ